MKHSDGIENAIVVTAKTRYEELTARFNTPRQAKFYINQAQSHLQFSKKSTQAAPEPVPDAFDMYEEEHTIYHRSLEKVQKFLSSVLKVKVIDRSFLPNYVFSKVKDLVVVVGRDGLVANTAKYVSNIPIIGINPDPQRYDGVLLPFLPDNFQDEVMKVLQHRYSYKSVTMAEAKLNDGQRLLAFNDLFIGPSSHISARYKISFQGYTERHSSSGIIISTGAGSTGWLSSLFNMANGIASAFSVQQQIQQTEQEEMEMHPMVPKQQLDWSDNHLVFVVREPFISKHSKASITAGMINPKEPLELESLMPENCVIFSDGIESDFLQFNSGAIANIGIAQEKAVLVMKL